MHRIWGIRQAKMNENSFKEENFIEVKNMKRKFKRKLIK